MLSPEEDVVKVLRERNREFRELEKEHRRLEEELSRLAKRNILSSSKEVLEKEIKKEKLRKKDKMAEIMRSFINLNKVL